MQRAPPVKGCPVGQVQAEREVWTGKGLLNAITAEFWARAAITNARTRNAIKLENFVICDLL
jgi:hypothetical protein